MMPEQMGKPFNRSVTARPKYAKDLSFVGAEYL